MQEMNTKEHEISTEQPINSEVNLDDVQKSDAISDITGDITDKLSSIELEEKMQIVELEKKVAEMKDLYMRSQAEIQNAQRRSHDEVKKARDYAIVSFAKDIVVVKDYLEMALKDQSGNFEAIKTGVDLTLKQLIQIFEKQMIKDINPISCDKLDPHLHQAMNSIEVEGQEPNTIVDVMQKGYMLNERVLRPAMVTVSK